MSKIKKEPVKNTSKPAAKPDVKNVPQTAVKELKPGYDLFSKIFTGREVYFLLAMMIIGCIIVFKDFITLEKVYLFRDIGSDSINIYFPWLAHMTDYIKANGIPTWTFSQGLGQNVFPLWLGDFFANIVMLLFKKESLPYTLAFVEIIKILLAGFIFYKYLSELKLSKFAACLGGFLFAFCGYIILGGCWTIFSVEAVYAALILYGFERWLNHGKFFWLVIGLMSMSFLQPFFLFPYSLFFLVYLPVRYNDVYEGKWNKFPMFILKTAGIYILGIAISAYQLFPDLLQYIESPRVGGEAQLITRLKAQPLFGLADGQLRFTTIFRAFSSDMLGTGSDFKGWQNYLEAPLFYCGIFCLVTLPQVFSGLNKSQKIAYGILTAVFVLPIFFPFFRYTFWAYTGDYFRTFSLIITLLMLIFSAKALDQIIKTGKVNLVVLGITIAFLLFLLYAHDADLDANINQGQRSFVTLLIFVYGGLLFALTRQGNIKSTSMLLLIVVCFFEMIYFSSTTVNDRNVITSDDLKQKVGYNDYTVDAVKYLKDHDNSFYRINKDYHSGMAIHQSINDAKVQGYYSTPSYFSFNQKNYVKFLGTMNIINPKDETQTRWILGLVDRPLLLSLTSCKYWLSNRPTNYLQAFGYDSVATFGNVKILRNRYSLPLGFAYEQVLDETSFKTLSPAQKDIYLMKGFVAADDDNELLSGFKKFNLADTALPPTLDQYFQNVALLRKDSLHITSFKESDIKGDITLAAPGMLFFSIPYDEGWTAKINGTETKLHLIDCGLTGLKLPAGKSSVELSFEPRLMKKGGIISLFSILVFIGILVIERRSRKGAFQK